MLPGFPAAPVRALASLRATMGDITELLRQARTGDQSALDALFTELHPELRRLAHARLARGGRHTLARDGGTDKRVLSEARTCRSARS